MKVYDIDKIRVEQTKDGLFDLTTPTFIMYNGAKLSSYVVEEGEEMRIDLVCNSIYRNSNYVDFLMNLNGIINPMNIRSGDTFIYVEENSIQNFRAPEEVLDNIKATFINLNKKNSKDKNRELKKNDKTPLPPTVNQRKIDPIKIRGNKVTIGDGLFNI